MSLRLQTPAAVPAVSLAEAKLHLRVDVSDDDALIGALVAAATLDAEHLMSRAIMPQKWQYSSDAFHGAIALQRPTVTAVDSVKYVDPTGLVATMAPSAYQVVMASDYSASVVPAYGQSWPATRAQPEAVQVIFSCGYADAASVPELIKAWIKIRLGILYENREGIADSRTIPLAMTDGLLDRYRVWSM